MKLERIDQDQNAGYPTLKAHRSRRNGVVKTAMGGLALAALAGCCQNAIDRNPPEIMGEMPVALQPPSPQRLPGELVAPEPPVLMGIMVAPTPPAAEDEK